jgi:hypothetical protein
MEGPVRYRRQESKRDCWSGEGEDASEMGRRTRSTPELKRKKHMLRQVQACDRTSGSGFEGFEFRRVERSKSFECIFRCEVLKPSGLEQRGRPSSQPLSHLYLQEMSVNDHGIQRN